MKNNISNENDSVLIEESEVYDESKSEPLHEEKTERPNEAASGISAFEPKKNSADVLKPKKKGAAKLNRQLIFGILICSLLTIFLLTYFSLGKTKPKESTSKVGSAREAYIPDFEAMSDNAYKKAAEEDSVPDISSSHFQNTDEDALIQSAVNKMPDLNESGKAPVDYNSHPKGSGGGYAKPDTRNNYVQKPIQGIKGLTPTGRQVSSYSNDISSGQQQISHTNPYGQFNLPSKDEFIKQILGAQGLQGSFLRGYNDNVGKENFYSKNKNEISKGEFLGQLTLWQGTVIPAVLITGINTDLPGNIIARVTKNIYSSIDGKYLLIPQGTLLFAGYNSSVSYAQNRIQVGWTHMIRPDGFFLELGNMAGVDAYGNSGYKGKVNNHPWAFIKGLLLVSSLAILDTDLHSVGKTLQKDPYADNVIKRTQDPYKKITEKIIDRALDIQPTITIKSGISINILTNANLILPPVEIPEVTQKYKRY